MVFPLTLTTGFILALALLMVWVIISDVRRYVIPNTLNLAVIVLFAAAALLLPSDPLPALGAAVLVLVLGLGFFALGLMGGGDVKLLVGLTLWTGWDWATLNLFLLTALCGGVLVLVIYALRATVGPMLFKANPARNLPRILTRGQQVPYGLAIAPAFLWLMAVGGVPMLTH